MDPTLRGPRHDHDGPWVPIFVRHFSAADEDVGHKDIDDDSVSPGIQRSGGTTPQTIEGGANSLGTRRA